MAVKIDVYTLPGGVGGGVISTPAGRNHIFTMWNIINNLKNKYKVF